MTTVELECVRTRPAGRASGRTAAVGHGFGITLESRPIRIAGGAQLRIQTGQIVLLVGPSGSGKTTALERIHAQCPGACFVQRVAFPADVAVVDRIAPWAALADAASIMTACGLGEVPTWIRPFATLSEGEKFRARLARAVALHARAPAPVPLLCDEFCSNLHRRAARAISFNLRKLVSRRELSMVLACSNEDIIDDLRPDTIVRFTGGGQCAVDTRVAADDAGAKACEKGRAHKREQRRDAGTAISFRRKLRITLGSKSHYDQFAPMHYRAADELGFVDKVFIMREGFHGDILGVVVYSHSPLELALRNQATAGRFLRKPRRLNRSMRILRRLVIHPDVRGCGLGQWLVKRTLPRVGTEYVECLAAMGEFNPVFEKAGMQRIGQYPVNRRRQAAIDALTKMGIDPAGRDFILHVTRRRSVREIVAGVVYDWYESTTGGGKVRVNRQSPEVLAQTFRGLVGSRPVYYLWRKPRRRRGISRLKRPRLHSLSPAPAGGAPHGALPARPSRRGGEQRSVRNHNPFERQARPGKRDWGLGS